MCEGVTRERPDACNCQRCQMMPQVPIYLGGEVGDVGHVCGGCFGSSGSRCHLKGTTPLKLHILNIERIFWGSYFRMRYECLPFFC